MCGIAAISQHPDPLPGVQTMLSYLRHRGDSSDPPEAIDVGSSALGSERLRIVDFAGGRQPVTSFDGQWKIVFNGEIYNHAVLRNELAAKGVRFRTECDTEVLVNFLAISGPEATKRLDGMFAFVALHNDGRRWIAGRDPMGIKPLYFAREGATTYFASEIYPLLQITAEAPIEEFPPGEWRTESNAGRHWEMPAVPPFSSVSLEENAVTLKQLLENAVAKRLPSNLPCAVLFSGGIDSTLIFHIARKLRGDVKGFYIGNPHGVDYPFARMYADRLGADVEFVPYNESSVLRDTVPATIRATETFEPNQIRGGAFSYLLSEAVARSGYRVALCGEGADELFCGYPELCQPDADLPLDQQEELILLRKALYLRQLHRTQLLRVDRCAMRFALEVRVPFLDRDLLNFGATLPVSQLVNLRQPTPFANKLILRDLYRLYPEIPEAFSSREKIVFTEGSGMGNNAPRGPFYDHAVTQAVALDLTLDFAGFPRLRNYEEAFYFSLLTKNYSIKRLPFLYDRPSVNAR